MVERTEMDSLIAMLEEVGIPFEVREIFGTPQVFYPNRKDAVCDVICHWMSLGYEQGLLEIAGLTRNDDSVEGFLTSWEVYKRIADHWRSQAEENLPEE